jgi:4-amino-4-deoxy-L-arabinose transferase-like glycosyltransferase
MDDNNIIVFGLDLNRSPGVAVVTGVLVLVLAVVVALWLFLHSRVKRTKQAVLSIVAVVIVGLAAGIALAAPPLVRHYQWHEVSGEVQSLHVGTRAKGTPEEEHQWQFGFERLNEANPNAYLYRCEGETCVTLLSTRFVVARCHYVLWRTIALWEPPETCTVLYPLFELILPVVISTHPFSGVFLLQS